MEECNLAKTDLTITTLTATTTIVVRKNIGGTIIGIITIDIMIGSAQPICFPMTDFLG